MYTGPNIVRDGLILQFDPANIKCFRGEPTTNLLPNPTTFSGWGIDSSGASNLGTRTQQADDSFLIENNNSNYRHTTTISLSINTTYTISVKFKKKIGTPTFRWQIEGWGTTVTRYWTNGVQNCVQDKDGWQTLSYTFMFTDPTITHVILYFQSGADYINYTHSYYIKEPQLEQKDHATPFVNGTRGTTVATGGGLIDLSNNGNHGELVNGVLYDSNNCGSLVFDGVNDYVGRTTIANDTLDIKNALSISMWLYPVTYVGAYTYLISKNNTGGWGDNQYCLTISNNQVYISLAGTGVESVNTNYTLLLNKWTQVTMTWDGSIWIFYADGVYISTGALNGTLPFKPNFSIGRRNGAYYFNGKICQTLIYNRSLSQQEILQNYNASKSRYL